MESREDDRGEERRRRSPATHERRPGNNRRRSRSPVTIDRYQPGRRGDDNYRERDRERDRDNRPRDRDSRRSSPPPAPSNIDRYVPGQDQPSITHNPLPDPIKLDYQVGFSWFSEWWRLEQAVKDEKERVKNGGRPRVKSEKESREERVKEKDNIQAAYDAYKEKHQSLMAKMFVQQHKSDEWFKERYSPEIRADFRVKLCDHKKEAYSKFSQELDSGRFDQFTLEGIYKNDSNGASGVVEKEEGETPAANEVLGVGDLLPVPGADIRDESVNQPTLLIKTIAPTVGRTKMEEFCREKLGDGDGGFKWLSLSDPNAQKKFHRIGWVVLNPGSSETVREERGEEKEDVEEGEEAMNVDESPNQITASKALAELNGTTIKDEERGDFTIHVGVHETPATIRKKALWDLFSAPERIDRDLQLAIRITNKLDAEMGEDFNGQTQIDARVEDLRGKGELQPVSAPAKKQKEEDVDMEEEEEEDGMVEEEEEGELDEDIDDEEILSKKKRLDLLVEYLRRVHHFCLFCVFESDSIHELTRKCAGGHLRRPRASLTSSAKIAAKASANGDIFPFKKSEKDDDEEMPTDRGKPKLSNKAQQQLQRGFNWVKTYEDKLLQLLEPDSLDLRKLGGKPLEEGIEEELGKYVSQEDENRYRCKVPDCSKLFKGHNFWRKHVEKRHDDFYIKTKQDVELVNAYVLDPAHIAPYRDVNTNGQQMGTPRGFNLNNVPSFGLAAANNIANPVHIAALMSQMNGGALAAMTGADDDRHGVGAIRRQGGGNRFNQRSGHPYARPDKNRMWNGGNSGANPGGRPSGRFPEGGAGQMGPREAVQGRSLKSYEDLDATAENGNSNTGDLDY